MKALVVDGRLAFVKEHAQPIPDADQTLLKIRKAGICNTDLEIVSGYGGFAGILGHEFVADAITGTLSGRRVVGEINVACRGCDFCLRGLPTHCRNRTTVGIRKHPGAFAEYLALATLNLHPLPDSISDDAAVFVEPLSAALQVLETVHISPQRTVVLIGAGKLGLLVAQVIHLTGAHLKVIVRRSKPAQLLQSWGIQAFERDMVEAQSADIVIDCTGTQDGFADALALVKPRGTIVLKSTYVGFAQVDMSKLVVDEIAVVGSRCGRFAPAIRLLESGLIDTESLIEGRFSIDDGLLAFERAAQPGALKYLLEF
ncbi:MAG: alcohol dehydrogenase catalytic domain-containing protein [Aggregatilineales bacterium]